MKRQERVYLGLGSNLGDRLRNMKDALIHLDGTEGLTLTETSNVYETEPLYFNDQPDFLNMAAGFDAAVSPVELLGIVKSSEQVLGREPGFLMGPRMIDIDVIFYGSEIISIPGLAIPHRRYRERMFVLKPLCDIAAEFICPKFIKNMKELLAECTDSSRIEYFSDSPVLPEIA